MPTPAFASDPATAHYYDRRAAEYDEWYTGQGSFAERERPGWTAEVDQLVNLVRHLPPARTLDVACGTAFLTRHLRGFVVGLDQSPSMVAIAQSRLPDGLALVGDALRLVVADQAFDRVMTGHFYGHLPPDERGAFLCEAQRVAAELVVIDSAWRPGVESDQWQERRAERRLPPPGLQALPLGRPVGRGDRWRGAHGRHVVRRRPRFVGSNTHRSLTSGTSPDDTSG